MLASASECLRVWFLSMAIAACSCSGQDRPGIEMTYLDTLYLEIADTLGVLQGDTCEMFGMLASAEWSQDGEIAVLDCYRGVIQVFDPDSGEVARLGSKGDGPGFFRAPVAMTVLGANRLAVADAAFGKVTILDRYGGAPEDVSVFFPAVPMRMIGQSDTSFVGIALVFNEPEEGRYTGGLALLQFAPGPEPARTYACFEIPLAFSGAATDGPDFSAACNSEGEVFLAVNSDSSIHVERFSDSRGDSILLDERLARIPWPEAERPALGRISVSVINGNASAEMSTWHDPRRFRPYTSGIYCDSLSRIWLEMTYSDTEHFLVMDRDGKPLFIVAPLDPRTLERCDYSITPRGMLAIDRNPEDYPKILLLELRQ